MIAAYLGLFLENPKNFPHAGASMCVIKNGDVETLGFLDFNLRAVDLFSGDFDEFWEISGFSLPLFLGGSQYVQYQEQGRSLCLNS